MLSRSEQETPTTSKNKLSSRDAAIRAVDAALGKKGVEPVLLDVRELASYADYILIVSGRSDRQVQAISDGILVEVGRY